MSFRLASCSGTEKSAVEISLSVRPRLAIRGLSFSDICLSTAYPIFADVFAAYDMTLCGGGLWSGKQQIYAIAIAKELYIVY